VTSQRSYAASARTDRADYVCDALDRTVTEAETHAAARPLPRRPGQPRPGHRPTHPKPLRSSRCQPRQLRRNRRSRLHPRRRRRRVHQPGPDPGSPAAFRIAEDNSDTSGSTASPTALPAYPEDVVPQQVAAAPDTLRKDWIYHRLQDLQTGINTQDDANRYNRAKAAYCAEFTETRSISHALAGGGQVIVNRRTGLARLGTSAHPVEAQLDPR
jgi:hypothetical protein